MERVQFQQEQMLQELKDLVEKNIFTEKETKQIIKKRTGFETTLVRRVAKKADFLRYITYEMNLEQLRRKRVERLSLPPAPPTISDYALVRRQFHIFERALKRFKSDVALWIQYIELAKREGARALVGRITARALQLHPNKPALYIIAASHELDHLSPSAARTLLQRGIRMNPESIDMWREYVRMELGFVESLRRRWDVLGIKMVTHTKTGVEKGKSKAERDPSVHISLEGLDDTGSEDEGKGDSRTKVPVQIDPQGDRLDRDDDGEAAREQIMQGAIVKSVMTSAAQAHPKIGLFTQLKTVILEYPLAAELRTSLLGHLYDLVRSSLPGDPQAARFLVDRHITGDLKGAALVDGIQCANGELLAEVNAKSTEGHFLVYANFVEDWCQKTTDRHLKIYLTSCLQALIQQLKASPSLLAAHIRLLILLGGTDGEVPAKIVRMARKYTGKAPGSSQLWLARLSAEKGFQASDAEGRKAVGEVWREARNSVKGEEDDVLQVWMWGLGDEELVAGKDDKKKIHEGLLKESMGSGLLRGVHEKLLMSYVTVVHEAMEKETTSDQASKISARWLHEVRRIGRSYLTSGQVWQKVFSVVERTNTWTDGKDVVLGEVYDKWREKDAVTATVEWGRWLAERGKGGEASIVVGRAGVVLAENERAELEKRWGRYLDS